MSNYDLLRTIIGKSIVLTNFYTDPTDGQLDELNNIIKKDMDNLELEDIVLERLNEKNIVEFWNFVHKYDFHDKMKIRIKIYKYVRENNMILEIDDKLISTELLVFSSLISIS
jgi:hypothetical protein